MKILLLAAVFPLGTQLITGSVKNYLNELYTSENDVIVQAANTNGNILAECTVKGASAGSSGENYLLEVPVTSTATAMSIAPGDPLNLFVIDGSELKVAAGSVSNSLANVEMKVNLRVVNTESFASTSSYTNSLGQVEVAKEYLDVWRAYTDVTYNPDGDEDGDGASNYFEYLSGTNPFDESDYLAIKNFQLSANKTAALTFEYVGGHVYSVLTAESLSAADWQTDTTILPATATDEPGEITITVVPTEATSRFYMIDPQ